jgi:DNA repair exonuclease SbcCD nuclease subunit
MRVAILGDTHFGMRNDSLEFHNYYKKFYDEVFFPYLLSNNIQVVYQLGDLFDRRKFINFNTLHLARNYFFDKLKEHNIQFHTILGNHCIYYRNTLQVNSSELLLREYSNVHVYNSPTKIEIGGLSIDIIPWICAENESEIINFMKESKSEICFGHFEIDGFEMDRGNVCHGGVDKKIFSRYDVVLTGHFHHKSKKDNIFYVGTPGEMTWSDYDDERGFHIFDTETREMHFVRNPFTMFNKLFYDDTKQDFDFWKKYDFSVHKNTFVKVVVVNKTNPFLFDQVIDGLYKASTADISIAEDFLDLSIEEDQEMIDQAEDTITILSKYIDDLSLNVRGDKLKSLMRELYVEALNSETER